MIISLPIAVEVLAQGSVSDRKFASFAAVALERSLGLIDVCNASFAKECLRCRPSGTFKFSANILRGDRPENGPPLPTKSGGCGFQLKNL